MSNINTVYVGGKLTSIKKTQNPDKANAHAVDILNHFRDKGVKIKIVVDAFTWRVTIGKKSGGGDNLWSAVVNVVL